MTVSLESSRYCIERAKHHIRDFEWQVIEFYASKPYTKIIETDSDTSEELHKIKLVKPMPIALPGIAFDVVNNLRPALDQACYAINPQKNGSSFPFARNTKHFENSINGKTKHLPKEIVDLIRRFKPYKGGDNLLWALNELCNANKHAIVCPVATVSGGVAADTLVMRGPGKMLPPRWDRTKNEMILFRLKPGSTVYESQDRLFYSDARY